MPSKTRKPCCGLAVLCVLGFPSIARAQATGQIWSSAIVEWLATDRVTAQLEVEPKAQVFVPAGKATTFELDMTPHVDYLLAPWIDVLGEAEIQAKNQSNEVNTTTVAPRIGAQLHVLSRIVQARARRGAEREKLPRRRATISTLLRLENQFKYSTPDTSTTSSWRFRHRFDAAYPLNRAKTTVDGAVYLTYDGELFMPIDSTPHRAVSEMRFRTGLGFRRSFSQRFEALYIWTGERNEPSSPLAAQSHAIEVRVRLVF